MPEEKVKILFKFFSNLFDEETVEKIPALVVDKEKGIYMIQSVPLFAPMVAFEDLILAEFDKDEDMLVYKETIDYSGHSVIQIVITDENVKTKDIEKVFIEMDCVSEGTLEGYFTIGIPYTTDYKTIHNKLEDLEQKGTISYAEPCLSEKHRTDTEK